MKDNDPKVEMNLFDLLIRDLKINQEIYKTFRGNFTALKGYLTGIGNQTVRETFRMHIQDSEQVLASLVNQTGLILNTFEKAREKWDQQQPKPATSTDSSSVSATAVEEQKLSPSSLESSSASVAEEPGKSQPQQV